MADKPLVFILPGVMGSYLDGPKNRRGTTPRYWYSVGGVVVNGVKYLQLGADGVSAADAKWGQLTAPGLDVPAYSPLYHALAGQFTVQPLPYDWRLDVRQAAAVAWQTIQAAAGGSPFYVIAHSMGNFVARFVYRLALAAGQQDQFLRLVAIAAPYAGAWSATGFFTRRDKFYATLLAVTNLDNAFSPTLAFNIGELIGKKLGGTKGYTVLDKTICSWPSVYGLLPFPEVYPAAGRLYQASSYAGFNTFVQQKWLDNARAMQKELLDATKEVPKAKLVSIVGQGRATLTTIDTGKALDDTSAYQTADGDARVEIAGANLYKPSEGFAVSQDEHADIPKADYVLANIATFLLNGIPTEAPAPQPPPLTQPAAAPLLPKPIKEQNVNPDWRYMLGLAPALLRPAERPSYCP